MFYGKRFRQVENLNSESKQKETEFIEDNGVLCMVKQKGNVLINNILSPNYENLFTEQSPLNINPISMDHRIYLSESEKDKDNDFKSLECLIGSMDGTVFVFDPLAIEPSRIRKFNSSKDNDEPFFKPKRPEIVSWVEAKSNRVPEKFVVAFEDGSIYLYEKDLVSDSNENYQEALIRINNDTDNPDDKKNFKTKADIVLCMQSLVEDFDFNKIYNQGGISNIAADPKLKINKFNDSGTAHNIVNYSRKQYDLNHKQYNFACAYYKPEDRQINPKLILKFDCKVINHL